MLQDHYATTPQPASAVERDLRERVKELGCLYAISRLAQRKDISLTELSREVARLLCASWQFPEHAAAEVELNGFIHATRGFKRTRWRQRRMVKAYGEKAGHVEICYLRKPPPPLCAVEDKERVANVFLEEETHLLRAVAEHLGRILEARKAEENLQLLSQELIRAQEMERQRIARELHDDVAQSLSMLKISIESLARSKPELAPEVQRQVQEISSQVSMVIGAVRNLSYDLLPPGLAQLGLVSTIFRLCEEFSVRYGIRVDFRAEGMDNLKQSFEFQINVYRIVQETLSNIRKHSKAKLVYVKLVASHPSVLLRVEDDGRGFTLDRVTGETARERHMGLWSMGERARLLGGNLQIRSAPGKGTKIMVEIPLERHK